MMMKLLLAACLAVTAKAQSQCSADYLAQVNTLCCADASGADTCHGGQPTRCNGNCATMFLVRSTIRPPHRGGDAKAPPPPARSGPHVGRGSA